MTTDNFRFYLQNRLIQTSQTGGQRYSDTSAFSILWPSPENFLETKHPSLFWCSDSKKEQSFCEINSSPVRVTSPLIKTPQTPVFNQVSEL